MMSLPSHQARTYFAGIGENCGDLTCIAERIRDGLMHFPVTIRKRWNLWMIQGFGFGLR